MVTYLDRTAIGTLAPGIRRDLGLSAIEMGWVFTAFQLAYGLFEVPTGRWADRVGTRSVLARIVIWWSVMTMATAAAVSYATMLAIRFLFGAGEAGAWPSVARTFSRWIPQPERGRVQGIFFAGAHLVSGLTPAFIVGGGLLGPWPGLLTVMSWRGVFVTFGVVGLVWVAIWLSWFRNDPSEHPSVSPSELALIVAHRKPVTEHGGGWAYWRTLIRSRNMIALSVMYIPNCMIFYFCITWLPSYLLERHGFNVSGMALFAGLPLLVSMPGDLLGGWLTDRLCSRYGLRVGRCGLGAIAYVGVGICLIAAASASAPVPAALLIAAATGLTMFTLGAAWGTVMEIGGNHVGVVGGTMNSIGNLIAMLNPLIVAYSVSWFGSWDLPLYVMGVLFLVG
ncbi:MAG TPA: MFS transporter, partial [Candidatus Limnocylindrales bacterium]|nr:MFS transporter [Candidatus Limnocylindrales bacterium]